MRTLALTFAALLLATGCRGTDTGTVTSSPNPGATPADQAVVVDIAVKDGSVTPQAERVDVKVGQEVTLRITSDAAEEIHVHSDPERTYRVEAGDEVEESFTIDRPGQVAVEAHELEATVVQLVVRP